MLPGVIEIRSKIIILILMTLFARGAFAQIAFQDVTEMKGISYSGPSFGASWGDFNGDGRPDLWVGSHGVPRLYINSLEGPFELLSGTDEFYSDNHGASWADFDNDGDQDLLVQTGAAEGTGSVSNWLLVNEAGQLTQKAAEFGLSYSLGRGRTPLWFDWNNDGLLDILLTNNVRSDGQAPSAIFTQSGSLFVNDNVLTGFSTNWNNQFAILGWGHQIDRPLLLVHSHLSLDAFLRFDVLPWEIVSEYYQLIQGQTVRDIVSRDFNGDGDDDYFFLRANNPVGFELNGAILGGRLEAVNDEVGVEFSGGGADIQFSFSPEYKVTPQNIFIGANGVHPVDSSFVLNSDMPEHQGIAARGIDDQLAVYIGFDVNQERWQIFASQDTWFGLSYLIQGEQALSAVNNINATNDDGAQVDWLYLAYESGIGNATGPANLFSPRACESVAAADFDNDMDVDLYLVCRGIVSNRANMLFANNGYGIFTEVPGAGGAAGSQLGMGESVAAADYDLDGFIDVFITNGRGLLPFGNGPDQLFRNLGNSNNWLEINLVGVESNRDGIGSRVEVSAGGITQKRLANGGMHRFSQDHARLHFGLANHQSVDEIVIDWPGGLRQVLTDVSSNQIITVTECGKSEIYPQTISVYEDAEDGQTVGWTIYDSAPSGAHFSNICDLDREGRVIELSGTLQDNGFRLLDSGLKTWKNSEQFFIEWSMQFDSPYTIFVELQTTAGRRFLTYQPVDNNSLGSGEYVYYGLGSNTDDGVWLDFARDLQADLAAAQPGVVINEVNAFLVRGSGRLDDIRLQASSPAADTDGDGVVDNSDNCQLIANSDQRDTNGDGYGNLCDPDLNNDEIVTVSDFLIFRDLLNSSDDNADLNGDGLVTVSDFLVLRNWLNQPPGPSGLAP